MNVPIPFGIGVPVMPPSREDQITKIQRGISDTAAVCSALGCFLRAAFPQAAAEAVNLETWLESYLNHNNEEYLEALRNPPPMPPGYMPPYDPTEQLVYLCKRRDGLQTQLDNFELIVEKLEKKMGAETGQMMRAQVGLSGLPQQLEELNEQISDVQKRMEASEK